MNVCKKCNTVLTQENSFGTELENICKNCKNSRRNTLRDNKHWEAIKYLGAKCNGCGKEATFTTKVCFDFHHTRDKTERVAKLLADGRPLNIILQEADKCILFCACCHRLHHQMVGY